MLQNIKFLSFKKISWGTNLPFMFPKMCLIFKYEASHNNLVVPLLG